MTRKGLTDLIDKVVGKRGSLRAPAWWVRKILRELVDWTASALSDNSVAVLSSVDEKMSKVKPYILASSWESNRYITIDGKSQLLSLDTPRKYYYTESFRFPADLCWVSFQHATLPVKDLSEAFKGCTRINGWPIDLRFLDTSEATSMRAMFQNTSLANFVTDNFDISSVTDLSYMFAGKSNTELRFSPTNNRKVTTVSHMFYNCQAKTIVCNSYWKLPIDMGYMFAGCTSLVSLNPDISYTLEVSEATDISYLFYNCKALQYLYLLIYKTGKCLDSVFEGCASLTVIGGLSKWKTGNAESMMLMFYNCSSLQTLDLSGFDTSQVTHFDSMFGGCKSLTSLNLSKFNTAKATSMYSMFNNCSSLQTLDLSGFDTSAVSDMSYMFYDCKSLTSLNLSKFDTSKVTNMLYMFKNCQKLAALTLSAAFFNPASLTTYDFSALTAWTDTDSLATLVEALPTISTAKTIKLSANTKAALTDEQKETITTTKGWTIA